MTEAKAEPRRIYDPIIDTPVCYVREGEGIHPPLDSPEYKSTQLRHPKHQLVYLPQQITELTGPALGATARAALCQGPLPELSVENSVPYSASEST